MLLITIARRFHGDFMRTLLLFSTAVLFHDSSVFASADEKLASSLQQAARRIRQLIAHRGASAERPECTLSAMDRAIETGATAVEVDVRTSADGHLFILHDASLDRTTTGTGNASKLTLNELQKLDAGSWFALEYRKQKIPSLIEAAENCRGRIDLLLDLKEQGDDYDRQVAEVIQQHGDPNRTIVGVRSVAQAKRFRQLLPAARQLGLIPGLADIEAFAEAGTETIRLWPRWLDDESQPVRRIRNAGCRLHLNGTMGLLAETEMLLQHTPDSLSSDHPARLRESLRQIAEDDRPSRSLHDLVEAVDGTDMQVSLTFPRDQTFLNRDYQMLNLPPDLIGLPRCVFNGGDGHQLRLRFRKPAVVLAVFDYNRTGLWSFADEADPEDAGWHRLRADAYRGSSNPGDATQPNLGNIWFREYTAGQELSGLPQWWVCLGVISPHQAAGLKGFQAGFISRKTMRAPIYPWAATAAAPRALSLPPLDTTEQFRDWQSTTRRRFLSKMLYPCRGEIRVQLREATEREFGVQQEFEVMLDKHRLFRFFRLQPTNCPESGPTIVCFMGHGQVAQILAEKDSYQHACAARFAEQGYLVYAMENVGMSPRADTHLDLDQSLRLEGYGWYSLLFAHQQILLQQVFNDRMVDHRRVAAAGVSTGGLLALSAAVIEPRIAAVSIQGIFGSMRTSFIRDRHRHCTCGAIPGLLPDFDLPELALLASPCRMQICHGSEDGFPSAEAGRCIELMKPVLQVAGVEPPEFHAPKGKHEFQFELAAAFFRSRLSAERED